MLTLLLTAVLVSAPQDIPKNDGWVTDLAGLLTPDQERSLEALMESYKAGTTHEIALLTVPSLDGRSLERYSLEVARGWGIGGEDANNGALLFVAKNDRKMRIEVGRGLEGTLTDLIAGRVIRDVIAPHFKREAYYDGLRSGIEAMHAAIGGDYGPIRTSSGGQKASRGGVGCIAVVVNFLFFLLIFGSMRRRMGGRSGGGILPWLILSSMHGGRSSGGGGGFGGSGGFSGFGGGGGFSGGGSSGGW